MKPKILEIALVLLILPLLMSYKLYPQEPQVSQVASQERKFIPDDNQKLRLKLAQKDAQLAQKDVDVANANLQRAIEAFNEEMTAIERENKWPENLQIVDGKTMEFKAPPEPTKDKAKDKK
jgi:hypothetical protein